MKQAIKFAAIFVLVILAMTGLHSLVLNSQDENVTLEQKRKAWMSGCREGGLESATCVCMERELVAVTPELYTDSSVIRRMIKGDFNSREIQAVQKCVG